MLTKLRRSYRYSYASGTSDCGPACIATVALHYGQRLSVPALSDAVETTSQGVSLVRLTQLAHTLGFAASSGMANTRDLRNVPLPAIVLLRRFSGNHYVVLFDAVGVTYTIADPAIGIVEVTRSDFETEWSGHILFLKPTEDFGGLCFPFRSIDPINIFWKLVGFDRRRLGIAATWAYALTLSSLTMPLLLRFLFEKANNTAAHGLSLESLSLVILLCAVVRGVMHFVRTTSGNRLSFYLEENLASEFLLTTLKMPLATLERHNTGDLVSRLHDATVVRSALIASALALCIDGSYLLGAALILCFYNLTVAAFALVGTMSILGIYLALSDRLKRYTREGTLRVNEVVGELFEAVVFARTIKVCNHEDICLARLSNQHAKSRDSALRRSNLSGFMSGASLAISGATVTAILYWGVRAIQSHRLSLSELLVLFSLATALTAAGERIGPSLEVLSEGMLSAERLLAYLPKDRALAFSKRTDISTESGTGEATVAPTNGGVLTLSGVSFSHRRDQTLLKQCTLHVHAGETLGIVGRTGSGKSTLAMICAGLYTPTNGSLHIDGKELSEWNLSELRRRLSIVFSDGNLFSGTLAYNIAIGAPNVTDGSIKRAAALACASDFIATLPGQLDYLVGHAGTGLSSGQRQRILLARAILTRPAILILDEATSNLDLATEQNLLDNLLSDRVGLTTIIISHRSETLKRADRIVTLQEGRIFPPDGNPTDNPLLQLKAV